VEIVKDILGALFLVSVIFSGFSFLASWLTPSKRTSYNSRYDWIIFLIIGGFWVGASILFGLLLIIAFYI